MLSWYLGQEVFMNGVRTYLMEFKYSNAETKDLWRHLSKASGKDVASLMNSWIDKMGYPVVSVVSESYNEATNVMTITLRQARFLSSGECSIENDSVIWSIPLGLFTTDDPNVPLDLVMNQKEQSFQFKYNQTSTSFWKLNFMRRGFFIVKYNPSELLKLSKIKSLSIADKIGLVSDSFSISQAGLGETSASLKLLENISNESDYNLLDEICSRINSVSNVNFGEPSVVEKLRLLKQGIFGPMVQSVGWIYKSGDHLESLKRTLIISAAGKSLDKEFILINLELWENFKRVLGRYLTGMKTLLILVLLDLEYLFSFAIQTNQEPIMNEYSTFTRLQKVRKTGLLHWLQLVHQTVSTLYNMFFTMFCWIKSTYVLKMLFR